MASNCTGQSYFEKNVPNVDVDGWMKIAFTVVVNNFSGLLNEKVKGWETEDFPCASIGCDIVHMPVVIQAGNNYQSVGFDWIILFSRLYPYAYSWDSPTLPTSTLQMILFSPFWKANERVTSLPPLLFWVGHCPIFGGQQKTKGCKVLYKFTFDNLEYCLHVSGWMLYTASVSNIAAILFKRS